MNAQQSTTTPTTRESTDDSHSNAPAVPETLPGGVSSAEAKLVYLYVRQRGACSAEELAESLRLTKLSLFPHLRTLLDRGLLRREDDRYVPAEDAFGGAGAAGTAD
ncbi:MarR family transcriptional regulator [Halobium salinum]|uniref:MarR family transcriptional regulator n=1 Tax=Halobium salinum TaxID=1364940 RepID=A0ABD5PAC1_9EURY|nr:MarR family transcriptional regulator [Halobium salinum]